MKQIVLVLFLCTSFLHLQSQNMYTASNTSKYGAINIKGDTIIPFKYEHIGEFENGYAKATLKEKVGIISTSGKEAIPFVYDQIKNLEDKMAIVSKFGVYGVINTSGDTIIPIRNQTINHYHKGTFLVYHNFQFGVIDTTGTQTIPFAPAIGTPFSGNDDYILISRTDTSQHKIVDRYNNEIYTFPGYGVRDLNDGYLAIWKKTMSDKLAAYLSRNKNQADEIVTYKIVDIEGNTINDSLTIEYDLVFKGGLSRISRNNLIGVINIKGQQVIPCEYNRIYDFVDGYAKVRKDSTAYGQNKYGIVSDRGKTIIPCMYDGIEDIKENFFLTLQNQKYGFLDTNGQIIIPFEYNHAQTFNNGYAIVAQNNKYGLIDKQAKTIIPLLYEQITAIDDKHYIVSQNLQFSIINTAGTITTNAKYKALNKLSDSKYIAALQDKKWGVIDTNGNTILPFVYNEITSYTEGLFVVK